MVNKANVEEGSEKFGSLSCEDFALIQRDSVRSKFAFCTSVLDRNKKQLRANVLLHFSTANILCCYGIARKTPALP